MIEMNNEMTHVLMVISFWLWAVKSDEMWAGLTVLS